MKNRKRTQILAIALFMSLGSHLNGQEICTNGIDDDNDGFLDYIDNDYNNLQGCTMVRNITLFQTNYYKRPNPDIYGATISNDHIKK